MQSSWSSAARNARGLLRNGAQTIAGGFAGAARGAKSVVNRMGRGIAGVGKAGIDSVARQANVFVVHSSGQILQRERERESIFS